MGERNDLIFAAKQVAKEAERQRTHGEAPMTIGIEGHLALMHGKIMDWMKRRDNTLILSLAADAVIAWEKVMIKPDELVPEVQDVQDVEA